MARPEAYCHCQFASLTPLNPTSPRSSTSPATRRPRSASRPWRCRSASMARCAMAVHQCPGGVRRADDRRALSARRRRDGEKHCQSAGGETAARGIVGPNEGSQIRILQLAPIRRCLARGAVAGRSRRPPQDAIIAKPVRALPCRRAGIGGVARKPFACSQGSRRRGRGTAGRHPAPDGRAAAPGRAGAPVTFPLAS